MNENTDKINQLLDKLDILMKRQEIFSKEVTDLKEEINRLKIQEQFVKPEKQEVKTQISESDSVPEIKKVHATADSRISQQQPVDNAPKSAEPNIQNPIKLKNNIEKFIGENLINKIGIAITIIGVAIGAKYAIEHQLISPLTRIVFGYLIGAGLLIFALKLKKKFENFSAVLLSGSMAIMYFITYAAYSFYELFPQIAAFVFMVIFTVFTVSAALNYNRQIIAHIGLVGAYAVPFLLSEDTGNVMILFIYTAIINIGILVIAFKKYWKPLNYSSFVITWLLYLTWFLSNYQDFGQFGLAFTFLSVFFVTFYLMFLAFKLLQKEKFDGYDIVLLLLNSFIFYGIGYQLLYSHETGEHLLGLFTLGNAILHFIVSLVIYRQKVADRNLFYFVSGLVLVFITIAIPVQLNGNWVTLLWVGEAAVLFWIGRTKNVQIYEILSYVLMVLAFFSIIQDWTSLNHRYNPLNPETRLIPFFNIQFLSSLLFTVAFGYINYLNRDSKYTSPLISQKDLMKAVSFSIPAIFIMALYCTFRIQISIYWDQLYQDSFIGIKKAGQLIPTRHWNADLSNFKTIWILNYSILFFSVMSFLNIKKIRNKNLGIINLAINAFILFVFLCLGLYTLSELRESYLQIPNVYYTSSIFNIGIRYISFVFAALLLTSIYFYIDQEFLQPVIIDLKTGFDIMLFTSLIWILSSELINWMDIMQSTQSYKLGLSILWGGYSLLLIGLGIWKKKKHLRISAIVLFGVTLLKLFFYDLTYLDTISKTIVFVTLGILLLIISFLYNKYTNIISDDQEN
jgi:uncharacterized membrane protein